MTEMVTALRAKYRVQSDLYRIGNRIFPFLSVTEDEIKMAEESNRQIIKAFHDRHFSDVLKKVKVAYTFIENVRVKHQNDPEVSEVYP